MTNKNDIFNQFAKKGNLPAHSGKTKAVIYTRVSTKEQAENNASLDTQLEFCNNCANKKNLNVVKYFGGTHESAKTDSRKEFNEMITYVKRHKGIGYIIVYNFKRFSRTGISMTYLDLQERGIQIISATQEVDGTTSSGLFHKHLYMEMGRMDNEDKRKSCIHGMQKRLRAGIVTGAIPFGYTNINPGKGKYAELVINEQGKLLKKAFELKAKHNLSYTEITERLRKFGWTKSYKKLSDYFRNPVYCGLLVSSLIPGEVIEGKHPPLVSKKLFLKVNDILKQKNYGGKYTIDDENLPLKQFIKSEDCGTPFTGYLVKKKGLYYYKNNRIGAKENRSAKVLHTMFEKLLNKFKLSNKAFISTIKEVIKQMFIDLHEESINEIIALEKKIPKLENNLEKIEERYVIGEIEKELYLKYKTQFEKELDEIRNEMGKSKFNLSNLELAIEKATKLALNLPKIWTSGNLEEKRRLQKMVFPEGILYNREKDTYRTLRVNTIFKVIPMIAEEIRGKENGTTSKIKKLSRLVLEAGLEPARPDGHKILSLACLPIPPLEHHNHF